MDSTGSPSASRLIPPRIDTSVPRVLPNLLSASNGGHGTRNFTDEDLPATPIPSVRISTSSNDPFSTRSTSTSAPPNPASRAKSESRKLLTHVLYQLLNRKRPPSISQTALDVGRDATEHDVGNLSIFREVTKMRKSASKDSSRINESDDREGSDDETDQGFSTESTLELMMQLQDVLAMSLSLRWQIFDEENVAQEAQKPKEEKDRRSRFRRSRHGYHSGKRSRSPSPSVGNAKNARDSALVPHLLSLCISVLASVISEDCRFQVITYRPSRPPNSLQHITLNVAQFLINTHCHDPKVISQVGFAVIPAFSTFQREMYGRLMIFFQDFVIRGVLETLRRSQSVDREPSFNVMSPIDRSISNAPVVHIHFDEAQNDLKEDVANLSKIQSSNAPHQNPIVYYLSSLVAPLLAAILEAIDVTSLQSTHELTIRFCGLLQLITCLKVDAYHDLLQIAAYHSAQSRKSACALLTTLWPKTVGHATISCSLAIPLSLDLRAPREPRSNHHQHQFIPWQYIHRSAWSNFQGTPQHRCSFCSVAIHGFGLLCPFCMCAVHFDCYDPPGGTMVQQYTMAHDASVQRIAMFRVSSLIPNRGESPIQHNRHNFELVTIFTLCLCYLCHQPLWGCVAQGGKCSTCSFIAHTSCLLSPSMPICGNFQLDSEHMTIDHQALRRSAVDYFPELRWNREQFGMLSYEEVLVIYDNLRTQLQLISNGVALSSIILLQRGKNAAHAKDFQVEDFELHSALATCKQLLGSTTSHRSTATLDYMDENKMGPLEHSILYDFSNLVYLSTAMKSPISVTQHPTPSAFLLNVNLQEPLEVELSADPVAHPYEAVPLPHIRQILNVEFNIHHPTIIKVLLNHLYNLSFFERLEPRQDITSDPVSDDALCVFPLPLGLDMSTDVETLVSSIETCLLDLDLSVNEFGFLLVIRKFWTNGLMSDYGLRRLARSILTWIVVEDDNLATILRNYVGKQKPLPGVRLAGDMPPWPFAHIARSASDGQSSNGRDYMTVRAALLNRYAVPWLLSLHEQDEEVYAEIVSDTCVELADERVVGSEVFDGNVAETEIDSTQRLNAVLFAIVKVSQASVTFTCSEELILRWLRLVSEVGVPNKPVAGLSRLFPRDTDLNRFSSYADSEPQPRPNEVEPAAPGQTNPFDTLIRVAMESSSSLSQALSWLAMISRSGIDVPFDIFEQFFPMITSPTSTLSQIHSFVYMIVLCLWPRSLGRQNFQALLGRLHSVIGAKMVTALKGKDSGMKGLSLAIIRQTFTGCLLMYGCDRVAIRNTGLVEDAEIKDVFPRRKLNSRAQTVDDPILVDPGILQGISQYLRLDISTITCFVAKFFHLFFTNSPLVASYEIDNFILKNGLLLAECAWKFYGIQRHDIAAIRSHFLLRIVVVDAEPFQLLIDGGQHSDLHWERRLVTVNRLSRIMVDVTSPAFHIDGRQWRSSVGKIFESYFSALWKETQEEIRLSVRVFSNGLLPAQVEAVAQCWNETLSTSPMTDKIQVLSFLIQLRPHLPGWKLVAWDNLIDMMDEYDAGRDIDVSSPNAVRFPYSTQEGPDAIHLLVSALMLAMAMIADGVDIDAFTLLKIKIQLIRLIGFSDLTVMPAYDSNTLHIQYGEATEIPEVAYPCVEALVPVVDAHHMVDMPALVWGAYQEQEDKTIPILVGYVFIDLIFNLVATVETLESLPVSPLKSLLESVYMILHKVDFDIQPGRSLQPLLRKAMNRIVQLAPKNLNYEIRQLALTVVQAFCKRCSTIIRVGDTVFAILENVTEVIDSLNQQSQDALVVQGKALILSLLSAHTNDGLMVNIFKRQLKPTFFSVLKRVLEPPKGHTVESDMLTGYLWRDTLSRAPDCDPGSMQTVINNLEEFVETVYHEGYSPELLTFTGQQFSSIMRRLSDSLFESVDSSPLLSMLALLARNNRQHHRELLPYIETTLRIALTRGSVTAPPLVRLINATQQKIQSNSTPLGRVASTLVEILSDALRLRARVLPLTLNAIIESLSSDETPIYPNNPQDRFKMLMLNLVENSCYFLDHHIWLDSQTENDFNVSVSAAKIVFQALEQDPASFVNSGFEVGYKLVNSLRSWSVLAIAALRQDVSKKWTLILYQHFTNFSHCYLGTMRTYAQSNLSSDSAARDINHAYIATKLWLMVAQRVSNQTGAGDGSMLRVWNELWPVFESITDGLEVEARAGLSSTLLILASATVADLLLFLRNLRSPAALEITGHAEVLNRLRVAKGETDNANAKVTRAFRAMSEAPVETTVESMLGQVEKEIIATEKMKNIEAKRDAGAAGGHRRKETRG